MELSSRTGSVACLDPGSNEFQVDSMESINNSADPASRLLRVGCGMTKRVRVAFVYDRINKWGGAERVLQVLHELFPKAPFYTIVYNPQSAPWAEGWEIRASLLNRIPFFRTRHELLAPFTAWAFRRFDFSQYDTVISITSAEAKALKLSPKTIHVCYCLTPTRYLWSHWQEYSGQGIRGVILQFLGPLLRIQDYEAAQAVTHFIAISETVATRVKKYYQRAAPVLYPPSSDLPTVTSGSQASEYYLVVSRLVPYKRVEIAIEACQRLNRQLVIVGTGNEMKRLKLMAQGTTRLVGHLTDTELAAYYSQCRAVLFPAEEDFGLVPVEAQRFGKPVLAYNRGGATETIQQGVTGLLVPEQTVESFMAAIQDFESRSFSAQACRRNAERFSLQIFKETFRQMVKKYYQDSMN